MRRQDATLTIKNKLAYEECRLPHVAECGICVSLAPSANRDGRVGLYG